MTLLRTPLYATHHRHAAHFMPFGGWDMPLHYGSQLAEHHAVRRDAGLFDVSHMRVVDVSGDAATDALRRLLANDVARLTTPGKALYSCLLNPTGGIVDDLIVYRRLTDGYRLVLNAATAERDLVWMQAQVATLAVTLTPRALTLLALQGPNARQKAAAVLPRQLLNAALALAPFAATEATIDDGWFIARTGYTGEDGFEIMLPDAAAERVWQQLLTVGCTPCGLGARDTLRLEAGMHLYGQDMDESTTPLDSGLGWTVAWEPAERPFIGRDALATQRASEQMRHFVGLLLTGRGVLRADQPVTVDGQPVGRTTSGGFAPTLQRSIALARLTTALPVGSECHVTIRGQAVAARVVKLPFVRHGQVRIKLDWVVH